MASLNKRKELVNQLRKAHFHLGFESGKNIESEYDHKYKQYMIQGNQLDNSDRRAHHYELGNSSDPNYTSEFKDRFPLYEQTEKFQLSKEKIDDLRKQHFALGYTDQAPTSTYKENYYKKSVPIDKAEHKEGLKKHNHDFGDSLTYFSSTYNEQHNKNLDNHSTEPKVAIDPQLLRKTNMVLGNEVPTYQTQHNSTYTQKAPSANYHVSRPTNNVDLGGDSGQFKSTHKADFSHKPNQPYKVDQQRIQDFKSAHFNLGSPDTANEFKSEHAAKFDEKPIKLIEAAGAPGTNINLDFGTDPSFNSTYKDNYQGAMGEKALPCKLAGELNSVSLGNDPNNFTSQGMARYVKHPLANNALDADRKKTLGKASLELGTNPGEFTTQHRDTYVDRFLQLKRSGMTDQEINNLRVKHFDYGFQGGNYGTTNADYGTRLGPPNKLDPEVQKGMRKTNMEDHDPDIKKTTTYKNAYHWKKNDQF